MTEPVADVVIVGAGAAGCAVAYYLTQLGVKPLIVEREGVASGASGGALGDLNTLTGVGLDGPLFGLARTSLEMHRELSALLKQETGTDVGFRLVPSLAVALEDDEVHGLRARMESHQGRGFQVRWLDADETRKLEPGVSPELKAALLTEGMGMLESAPYTVALLNAAEKHGAVSRHGELRGLEWDGDRVTGVLLASGRVSCGAVVLALGPWSGVSGDWLGTPVPVRPVKGQIVRQRVPGPPVRHYVTWNDTYAVAKQEGLTWTGTTMEEVGFDSTPTVAALDDILRRVHRLFPSFEDAEVVLQTACLRPVTSDWLPIIGPASNARGVYVATGGGRKGILLSPVMGKAVADLIVRGETDIDIKPFGLDRFHQV